MKVLIASLIALTPIGVSADEYQSGYSHEKTCFRSEYREEYVPGTRSKPGYVRSFEETIEIPCKDHHRQYDEPTNPQRSQRDDNDCSDGKIAGALIGGGAGAAMSRGDGRWWAIPLGAVVGSTVGCDLDGG